MHFPRSGSLNSQLKYPWYCEIEQHSDTYSSSFCDINKIRPFLLLSPKRIFLYTCVFCYCNKCYYKHFFTRTSFPAQLSCVHSHTFPAILYKPNLFGGKWSTGAVNKNPSSAVFSFGKSPCQIFALR